MPKIKEVVTCPNRPVLINFQNGKVRSTAADTALNSVLFMEKNTSRKLMGVANGDMLYSGLVEELEDYNMFLLVQEEGSKKLKCVQIDTSVVCPLREKATKDTVKLMDKSHAVGDLRKQFGSKKAKRYTEQQEKLQLNVENVKDHLEKTVADIKVEELPAQGESESVYRPRINRNAATKEGVYELPDLVSIEVLDSLGERVAEILDSQQISDFNLISTVEQKLSVLKESSLPENVILERSKVLLYVNYLVKFMITPVKLISKKFVSCDCSPQVDKYIKDNYMINGGRPLSMKDKGLCYVLVLLMLASDYEIDLEPISKDLKIGLKRVQEFARNLGFSQSTKQKTGIILKIPVPPPVMPNLKRKRAN